MNRRDIKPGMKLKAVGDYADCIKKGDTFVVVSLHRGDLSIACRAGGHIIGPDFADAHGEIPELEPDL